MTFADHFSGSAELYARHRPGYPPELFAWLASLAPHHRFAWDCATGSGQAAVALADHFASVLATDASAEQIRHARPDPRVEYRVARAEEPGIASGSVALVTVAQAAHWFHLPDFYEAARAALAPGGIIALWGYGDLRVDDEVDAVVIPFSEGTVGPYWPPERRLVHDEYRSIPFPFNEIAAPAFTMRARWRRDGLLGHLRSWSSVAGYRRAVGDDSVARLEPALAAVWGDGETREVRWPFFLRVGRITGGG
ncbi:MAG TPA: class I SAM-dependent methyltransferase [Longimicrobium sp.]|nr:class I SAM-dependent methyltransferase [Longimicrobium sp.]